MGIISSQGSTIRQGTEKGNREDTGVPGGLLLNGCCEITKDEKMALAQMNCYRYFTHTLQKQSVNNIEI